MNLTLKIQIPTKSNLQIESLRMVRLILNYLLKSIHLWEYRNPYSRKCLRCGRHEDMYSYADGTGVEWEEMYPLAHSPEKCQ